MVGMAFNGWEAFQKGDMLGTLDAAVGLAGVGLRGLSPCGWSAESVEALHRGILLYNAGRAAMRTREALEEGRPLDAALALADASINLYQLSQSCFTGEMLIEAEFGLKRADAIEEGDLLWSRDERDPDGPVSLKVVLARFVRLGRIWHLHLAGGLVRTTGEHPFHERRKGWVAASLLEPGDELATRSGGWVRVEEVYDTGEWERVYNWEIADFHTFFVGGEDWGFSVWSHNSGGSCANKARAGLSEDPAFAEGYEAIFGKNASNHSDLKQAGETFVRQHLADRGLTVEGTFENTSGNGIDIVARDADGKLSFYEVKTTERLYGRGLGPSQRGVSGWEFVESRLQRVAQAEGHYANLEEHSLTSADAINYLAELNAQQGGIRATEVYRVTVTSFDMTTGTGNIKYHPWR
jgi:hypothetical protein